MSQNYMLDTVAQGLVTLGAGGTLADLYAILSGNSAANAWPVFQSAISALPDGPNSDDPFGALGTGSRA
jgi:hypothetical protein